MRLSMDAFAWEALRQESTRLGTPEESLVAFALMYYLADVDSGRIARAIPLRHIADLPP